MSKIHVLFWHHYHRHHHCERERRERTRFCLLRFRYITHKVDFIFRTGKRPPESGRAKQKRREEKTMKRLYTHKHTNRAQLSIWWANMLLASYPHAQHTRRHITHNWFFVRDKWCGVGGIHVRYTPKSLSALLIFDEGQRVHCVDAVTWCCISFDGDIPFRLYLANSLLSCMKFNTFLCTKRKTKINKKETKRNEITFN